MKVKYTTGKFQVEAEGSTTEIFKQLAAFDSVFGNCKNKANDSENIGFRHRIVDENDYFEMFDKDTGHVLKFGRTKKDGSLFPRRKDPEGNWLDNNGWIKCDPNAPSVKQTKSAPAKSDEEIPF